MSLLSDGDVTEARGRSVVQPFSPLPASPAPHRAGQVPTTVFVHPSVRHFRCVLSQSNHQLVSLSCVKRHIRRVYCLRGPVGGGVGIVSRPFWSSVSHGLSAAELVHTGGGC